MYSPVISGHPRGLTPGTYGRIARDLLTFVTIFWPGTGALDRFYDSEARYTGKDPRDLLNSHHLENERSGPRGLGITVERLPSATEKKVSVSYVSLVNLSPFVGHPSLKQRKYFSQKIVEIVLL